MEVNKHSNSPKNRLQARESSACSAKLPSATRLEKLKTPWWRARRSWWRAKQQRNLCPIKTASQEGQKRSGKADT
ncbi:hypothetical protein CDAR_94971 [Caerostris darwini]|uniref:Uncharacterized protein n=1 Tax=Caerostris darwini TaxID=1538125 RepID=A0AAV4PK28_9ARAC|nr:hypothetical protein CDAR_94971 [Caerostris darwini]